MQAVRIPSSFDLNDLIAAEVPHPGAPGPGQILIRVHAVSLNYRDLLVARGWDRWRPPVGRIPVSDGVGTVEAVGAGVTRVSVGQRVITTILPRWISGPLTAEKREGGLGGPAADGVLAERVLLDAESVVVAPDYLTHEEAATLPVAALTAWHALTRADSLRPGKRILVQGTGGVALFALQLAVAAGASVIATSSSEAKQRRLRDLGAGATLNYRTQPDWDRAVLELTGGAGVDHVIDIGGADSLQRSIGSAACNGVVSIVGLIGGLQANVDLGVVFQKNLRLDGIETGSREMLEGMLQWLAPRKLKPVIDTVLPLSEAREAFWRLAGTHVGKVCIAL